ncbi:GAP family protein [Patescibacteria group bacterium]|nr:GAP family protein [Patescibacteria group bacterium]
MEFIGYLVTVTGLMNGLNPCALGLMMTFLGYLMVFGGKKNKDKSVLVLGSLYLFGVVITYLLLGLVFYKLAYGLQRSVWVGAVKYVLASIVFVFGLVQIFGIELSMPKKLSVWFGSLMKKLNGPISILVGGLTAVISAPCTLPVYVGTAMVLARSGMEPVKTLLYFIYYNILFVLPLLVVLILVYKGKRVVEMKEWSHKSERVLKIVGGVVLLFLSWFIFSS